MIGALHLGIFSIIDFLKCTAPEFSRKHQIKRLLVLLGRLVMIGHDLLRLGRKIPTYSLDHRMKKRNSVDRISKIIQL